MVGFLLHRSLLCGRRRGLGEGHPCDTGNTGEDTEPLFLHSAVEVYSVYGDHATLCGNSFAGRMKLSFQTCLSIAGDMRVVCRCCHERRRPEP
jgi:hypothetical protein